VFPCTTIVPLFSTVNTPLYPSCVQLQGLLSRCSLILDTLPHDETGVESVVGGSDTFWAIAMYASERSIPSTKVYVFIPERVLELRIMDDVEMYIIFNDFGKVCSEP